MTGIFDGLCDMMSDVLSESFGGGISYAIQTKNHGVVHAEGVFTMNALAVTVSPQGARQSIRRPQVDIRRSQLVSSGMTDLRKDLHGARVSINGQTYTITEPDDDGRAFVTCALRAATAP